MNRPDKRVILTEEFLVTGIFFLVMLSFAIATAGWPAKPRLLPLIICSMATVLLAWEVLKLFIRTGETKAVGRIPRKVIGGFIALWLVVPIAYFLGLATAIGVMGALVTIIHGERRWWVILLISISASLVVYLLFGKVFHVPMRY